MATDMRAGGGEAVLSVETLQVLLAAMEGDM